MPIAGLSASGRSRRLEPHKVALRAAALTLVFAAGYVGMSSGVSLSSRALVDAGPLARAYYTLSLFVIGGVDLGTPVDGPPWGRALLWSAYFLAPLITIGAVAEAALRMLNPTRRRLRRLHDHVVIAGAGRLCLRFVRKLRAADAHIPVVVIERNPANPRIGELEEVYKAIVVIGDVGSEKILERVHVERARRVMLLTSDDFANLDAASRLLERLPRLRGHIVAHVADLSFLRAVPPEALDGGYECYNSLESAAVDLVKRRLLARFAETEHRDLVLLAGFGRFGQTVLHQLQEHAAEQFGTVLIIDLEARANAMSFAESPGFGDYERHVIDGHLRQPDIWRSVDEIVHGDVGDPVIIVGTGDDGLNLHTALDLIRRYPGASITVRGFDESPFAEEVARKTGLHAFRLAELISTSMPRHWFE